MTYFEFNAGKQLQFVPRDKDLVEFDQPITEGIEVREFATLGEFLKHAQGEQPCTSR